MIQQYFEIKERYPDTILFFRMGDFYEMFFEDAKVAAPLLEVVLTSRDKNKTNAIPLCGIPHHARDVYAAKLLRKGYKVAICEQVEDPTQAKGIVKRDVTHVLTPGTALEIESLESELNKFVISIYQNEKSIAIASIDLSVSDFEIRHFDATDAHAYMNEIYRKFPKEIIIPDSFTDGLDQLFQEFPEMENLLITRLKDYDYNYFECENTLKTQLKIKDIEGLGLKEYPAAVSAAGALLKYLTSIRKTDLNNISAVQFVPTEDHLIMDATSFQNLEILKNLRTGSSNGSLFHSVDFTITPMGKRLLRKWLSYPSVILEEIHNRQDGIEEYSKNLIPRTETRKLLKQVGDIAKLNSKISLNVALPTDLNRLKQTLEKIPDLKKEIESLQSNIILSVFKGLDPLVPITDIINRAIAEDPSNQINDGNYIRRGFNQELDELRDISRSAKEVISAMEKDEKDRTGIPSLKIKYNRVFGYFIEVTKPHLRLIPPEYIRKQTLVNSERFITDELKKLEDKILKAQERIIQIEKKLYSEVINTIQDYSKILNENANLIGLLDTLSAGGELAQRRDYIRPAIHKNSDIDIQKGRHPVVESNTSKTFIPNDTRLNSKSDQILLITGPNMGGKSTYLRQNALIVILAQAGYFIPAEKAKIGICDRIFTRIGASDSLIEGKSTFLIEMIETSIILNNATGKSLILLDEIGRGTSTFDGLSIAWAVVEHLHNGKERPKTLFATHYHELTELGQMLDRVKNYHITVREWDDNVVFLHKIAPGATDQSFGIHVAKIAGVPLSVIERAKGILLNLEKKELNRLVKERLTGKIETLPPDTKTLFPEDAELKIWDEIRNRLEEIDIQKLTPLEALNILHYLKVKSDSFK